MKANAGPASPATCRKSTRSRRRRRDETATAPGVRSMKVLIPGALRSYTKAREVEASGATLAALLADLDRRYPGLRFRMIDEQDGIRPHMRFFINGEQVFDMNRALRHTDEVHIVQALSGG